MEQPSLSPKQPSQGSKDPMDTYMPRWREYQRAILKFLHETLGYEYPLFLENKKDLVISKGMLRTFSASRQQIFDQVEGVGSCKQNGYLPLRMAATSYLDRFTAWVDEGQNNPEEAEKLADTFISMIEPYNKVVAAISFEIQPSKDTTVGNASKLFLDSFRQYCLSPFAKNIDYVKIVESMHEIRNGDAHGTRDEWKLDTSKKILSKVILALMAVNAMVSQIHLVRNGCGARFQSRVPGTFTICSEGKTLMTYHFGDNKGDIPLFPNKTNWFATAQLLLKPQEYDGKEYSVTFQENSNNAIHSLGSFKFVKQQSAHFYFKSPTECLFNKNTLPEAYLIQEGRNLLREAESPSKVETRHETIHQEVSATANRDSLLTNPFSYRSGSSIDVEQQVNVPYKGGVFNGCLQGEGDDRMIEGNFIFERDGLCFKGYAYGTEPWYACAVYQGESPVYEGRVDKDFHFLEGMLTIQVQGVPYVYQGTFQGYHLKHGLLRKGGDTRYYGCFHPNQNGPYYQGPGIRIVPSFTHIGNFIGGKSDGFGIRLYKTGNPRQGLWRQEEIIETQRGKKPFIRLTLSVLSGCRLTGDDLDEYIEGEKVLFLERGILLNIRYQNEAFQEGELSFPLDTAPLPDEFTLRLP